MCCGRRGSYPYALDSSVRDVVNPDAHAPSKRVEPWSTFKNGPSLSGRAWQARNQWEALTPKAGSPTIRTPRRQWASELEDPRSASSLPSRG